MVVDELKKDNVINGISDYDKVHINYNPNGSRILLSE